jgi:hypothetical protein
LGLTVGVGLGVFVAVAVGVALGVVVAVAVAVAVAVGVGDTVTVGVAVGVGLGHGNGRHQAILTVSTRQPSLEPLVSLAILQRRLPPVAIKGTVTTVVMKPSELPLQA